MPLFPMAPGGDPQISPDGSRTLFTYSEVNMEEDARAQDRYLR